MILFYSLRAAGIAVLVNLLPIGLVMGIVALMGIPFDFSTVLISSITLGLSVDNSIHLIHHLTREEVRDGERKSLFSRALEPIGVVTLIFLGVFALFFLSPLVLLQRFGILGMGIVALAFVINAFLVPSLVTLFYREKLRMY